MKEKQAFISENRLAGDLEFKMFVRFEKAEEDVAAHELNFIPNNYFENNTSLITVSKKNSFKSLAAPDYNKWMMLIKLAGKFYSTDEFRIKKISADETGIMVLLTYIKVESEDGIPFTVNPFLIIPLNSSLIKLNKIQIDFETVKRTFSTGKEQTDFTNNIASFSFSFQA